MRRQIPAGGTHLGFLLLLAGLLLSIPTRTHAQSAPPDDTTAIVRAALEYQVQAIRQKHGSTKRITFDPRPMYTKWLTHPTFRAESIIVVGAPVNPRNWKPERTSEQLETITRGLDVGVGRLEEVVECPQGPRTCRMNDADMVIVVSEPGIVDGVAKVRLQVNAIRDDPRQRLGMGFYEFTLARTAAGWRVTDAALKGGT
jgi:hypothetical protein